MKKFNYLLMSEFLKQEEFVLKKKYAEIKKISIE